MPSAPGVGPSSFCVLLGGGVFCSGEVSGLEVEGVPGPRIELIKGLRTNVAVSIVDPRLHSSEQYRRAPFADASETSNSPPNSSPRGTCLIVAFLYATSHRRAESRFESGRRLTSDDEIGETLDPACAQ